MYDRDKIDDRRRQRRRKRRRGRYASLDLDGRETVIYDRDNPDAWIQSDRATPLDATA